MNTHIRERETDTPEIIPQPCGCDLRCEHHHPEGHQFYVSQRRDGRTAILLGPFDTHVEALRRVDAGRRLVREADLWSDFDSFGTLGLAPDIAARVTPVFTPDGNRNPRAGYRRVSP